MPRKIASSKKDADQVSVQRPQDLDTLRVISLIPLRPYHVVADVGCGPGYFAVPLGKVVFDGKVYAVDAQQKMLDLVGEELERVRLTNVELVKSKKDKLPLEDDSLDGAISAFGLHGSDNVQGLLEEALGCLRQGGWLALLEWHKREMDEGPPLERRIDEDELRQTALEVGFRFTARHALNDRQYMLLMRK